MIHNELVHEDRIPVSKRKRRDLFETQAQRKERAEKENQVEISTQIDEMCKKHDAYFTSILFADEFKYEPFEIINHHKKLFSENNCTNVDSDDTKKFTVCKSQVIAIDFEELGGKLAGLVNRCHNTSIKHIKAKIQMARGVHLIQTENQGQLSDCAQSMAGTHSSDTIAIDLTNVQGGFNKSMLFKLRIDLNNFPLNSIKRGCKTVLLNSTSEIVTNTETRKLNSDVEVRLCSSDSINGARGGNSSPTTATAPLNLCVAMDMKPGLSSSLSNTSFEITDKINISLVPKISNDRDPNCVKRQIELDVMQTLDNYVLQQRDYNYGVKESISRELSILSKRIWKEVESCTSSTNHSSSNDAIEKWSEKLSDEVEMIGEGYGLRYYQVSNVKSVEKFFELLV
ncbi:unnamed protein product [Ambrosiozyma monospora]|uniref:Unnamed protein product n=1 Tax=Ambrosiozyma monospora TaxID=43982 RepID=A0ACB5T270_AMBMO|nr:unnamed protein product [Ambrosiozyma monospora]